MSLLFVNLILIITATCFLYTNQLFISKKDFALPSLSIVFKNIT